MTVKQRLLAFLDTHKMAYTLTTHPTVYTARELASTEHLPPHSVAKTVVFLTEAGYGIAVLPSDSAVNLEELRLTLGHARLRLATEAELADLFQECELGAMPPFGNGTLFELPVYMEQELSAEGEIAFNAGTHRDVIHMRLGDFANLVKPKLMHFSRHMIAHSGA
jgi:Ala-tRNA(Pro) deacylase